jgi:MarR family 2-MHQ and catechol resistance regulon transcriptional repressor
VPSHHRGSAREVLALTTYIKLVRAAESVTARVAPRIAAAGLSASQFGVLEALYHLGPLHQRDLAERILKTSGNVTVVIGNLERRGLVRRIRSMTDRRFILVRLSSKGERLIRRIFPGHATAVTQQICVLSAAEQRTLGRLCRRVGLGAAG